MNLVNTKILIVRIFLEISEKNSYSKYKNVNEYGP